MVVLLDSSVLSGKGVNLHEISRQAVGLREACVLLCIYKAGYESVEHMLCVLTVDETVGG